MIIHKHIHNVNGKMDGSVRDFDLFSHILKPINQVAAKLKLQQSKSKMFIPINNINIGTSKHNGFYHRKTTILNHLLNSDYIIY